MAISGGGCGVRGCCGGCTGGPSAASTGPAPATCGGATGPVCPPAAGGGLPGTSAAVDPSQSVGDLPRCCDGVIRAACPVCGRRIGLNRNNRFCRHFPSGLTYSERRGINRYARYVGKPWCSGGGTVHGADPEYDGTDSESEPVRDLSEPVATHSRADVDAQSDRGQSEPNIQPDLPSASQALLGGAMSFELDVIELGARAAAIFDYGSTLVFGGTRSQVRTAIEYARAESDAASYRWPDPGHDFCEGGRPGGSLHV